MLRCCGAAMLRCCGAAMLRLAPRVCDTAASGGSLGSTRWHRGAVWAVRGGIGGQFGRSFGGRRGLTRGCRRRHARLHASPRRGGSTGTCPSPRDRSRPERES
eukprot:3422592-Prymnesium_polylepis.1